jgi:hypothetical protein
MRLQHAVFAPGVRLGLKEISHDQDRHYLWQRIEDHGTEEIEG